MHVNPAGQQDAGEFLAGWDPAGRFNMHSGLNQNGQNMKLTTKHDLY